MHRGNKFHARFNEDNFASCPGISNKNRFLLSLLLREFLANMLTIECLSIHLQVVLPSAIAYILMSANFELEPTSPNPRIRKVAVLQVRVSTADAQILKSATLEVEPANPDPRILKAAMLQ